MLLWLRLNSDLCSSYEVWPLIKVVVWVEYNKLCFWTKRQVNIQVAQTVDSILKTMLNSPSRNFIKSLICNSELTCLRHFNFQIHKAAQLNSLIWVEVPFVKETTKQVSSLLEHVWTLKSYCKNSKKFLKFSPELNLVFSFIYPTLEACIFVAKRNQSMIL